jgi:hypothetical protein
METKEEIEAELASLREPIFYSCAVDFYADSLREKLFNLEHPEYEFPTQFLQRKKA